MKVLRVTPTSDPVLDICEDLTKDAGYRIVSYDLLQGEFPDGCIAAFITGPTLPPKGLPFCVPDVGRDIWARRIVLVLSDAYLRGVVDGPSKLKN